MGLTDNINPLSTVLSSDINKSQQQQEKKNLGNAENQTQGRRVQSEYATESALGSLKWWLFSL